MSRARVRAGPPAAALNSTPRLSIETSSDLDMRMEQMEFTSDSAQPARKGPVSPLCVGGVAVSVLAVVLVAIYALTSGGSSGHGLISPGWKKNATRVLFSGNSFTYGPPAQLPGLGPDQVTDRAPNALNGYNRDKVLMGGLARPGPGAAEQPAAALRPGGPVARQPGRDRRGHRWRLHRLGAPPLRLPVAAGRRAGPGLRARRRPRDKVISTGLARIARLGPVF